MEDKVNNDRKFAIKAVKDLGVGHKDLVEQTLQTLKECVTCAQIRNTLVSFRAALFD